MHRPTHSLLLLLFPLPAFAGTSDPGGIAAGILWVILIAYGVWILIAVVVGRSITSSTPLRTLVAASLASLPLAYCEFTSYQFNSGIDELSEENLKLVSLAKVYLNERCAQDRIQLATRQVDPSGGVFLSVYPEQRLDIPGTPPPPVETPQMRENQRRYGESYPAGTNELQYKLPVYWVRQMLPDSVLIASPFDFVEANNRYASGSPLTATARKRWWLGLGQKSIHPASRDEFDRRLADMPEAQNYWLSQPVASSSAQYVLSALDISTLEDRRHWVARARLLLTHKASGDIAAEYVGFAANVGPAYRPGTSYPWEKVIVCPGTERKFQEDRRPFDVVGFFFREVVTYQSAIAQ